MPLLLWMGEGERGREEKREAERTLENTLKDWSLSQSCSQEPGNLETNAVSQEEKVLFERAPLTCQGF